MLRWDVEGVCLVKVKKMKAGVKKIKARAFDCKENEGHSENEDGVRKMKAGASASKENEAPAPTEPHAGVCYPPPLR